MADIQNQLNALYNHRGRFTTIVVDRVKSGRSYYCAQIRRITNNTLVFRDVNARRFVTVPLRNVVSVG
jgi:hypothetical protein